MQNTRSNFSFDCETSFSGESPVNRLIPLTGHSRVRLAPKRTLITPPTTTFRLLLFRSDVSLCEAAIVGVSVYKEIKTIRSHSIQNSPYREPPCVMSHQPAELVLSLNQSPSRWWRCICRFPHHWRRGWGCVLLHRCPTIPWGGQEKHVQLEFREHQFIVFPIRTYAALKTLYDENQASNIVYMSVWGFQCA